MCAAALHAARLSTCSAFCARNQTTIVLSKQHIPTSTVDRTLPHRHTRCTSPRTSSPLRDSAAHTFFPAQAQSPGIGLDLGAVGAALSRGTASATFDPALTTKYLPLIVCIVLYADTPDCTAPPLCTLSAAPLHHCIIHLPPPFPLPLQRQRQTPSPSPTSSRLRHNKHRTSCSTATLISPPFSLHPPLCYPTVSPSTTSLTSTLAFVCLSDSHHLRALRGTRNTEDERPSCVPSVLLPLVRVVLGASHCNQLVRRSPPLPLAATVLPLRSAGSTTTPYVHLALCRVCVSASAVTFWVAFAARPRSASKPWAGACVVSSRGLVDLLLLNQLPPIHAALLAPRTSRLPSLGYCPRVSLSPTLIHCPQIPCQSGVLITYRLDR